MAVQPPSPPGPLILLIEDDTHTVSLVTSVLEEAGYAVRAVDRVDKGRELLAKLAPRLLILDRKLPDADGLDLCVEIRQRPEFQTLPVLFLSARKALADKLDGLKMGGDDYLAKPFSPAELLARVQAILRRSGPPEPPPVLEAGKLRLDMRSRKAFLKEKPVELWAKEFDLLALLVAQQNRVLTREFLLQHVWGYDIDSQPSTKVVDVTISHLRSKLGGYGERIASVRGFGYRFDPA